MQEKKKDGKGRILRKGEAQRSDGKYMFRYTDQNGERQTVYSWKLVDTDKVPEGRKCARSLRDLEKEIRRDLEDNIRTKAANTMTVDDSFQLFMKLRTDLKESTRCSYTRLYNSHVHNTLGSMKMCVVTATNIKMLYANMFQKLHLKRSTVQCVHTIVYQLFDNAVADNIIRTNPAQNALKLPKKMLSSGQEKRHALTEEEQANFIDFVYRDKTYRRWSSLFTVLLGTGMRIGEALGLRWCDCDFQTNVIRVNHTLIYAAGEHDPHASFRISEPKTEAGIRIIPMFDDVRRALLRVRAGKRDFGPEPFSIGDYTGFIFLNSKGRPIPSSQVSRVIQACVAAYNQEETLRAEKEGIEPCHLPIFSAHTLRHTFCTRLCENERNIKIVQEIMGHRRIATTMEVYNEATETKKQASFQALEGKIKLA